MSFFAKASALLALSVLANAQSSCPSPSGSIRPSVASGYNLQVVATGLSDPRGVAFDSQGHLLVVEQETGVISSHVISDSNGCVTAGQSTNVVPAGLSLNHGIWINGTTLYASNADSVYSWTYDPAARTVSNQEELITGMNNSDHTTRTLLLPASAPGMMVVSRGSGGNLDPASADVSGGTAQVRAFNLNNRTGTYDWLDGMLLAWGTRNEVGLVEHPTSGGIWGVENSADQITRNGVDVSHDNPGEELNFFGYLNGTAYENQGGNFGYPYCLAVWSPAELPNNNSLAIGDQFAFDAVSALNNENRTDTQCADTVGPRLTFQAHMAPLDIKFNNSATEAWVTFHGSWDRDQGVGYKLSLVEFTAAGEPVAAVDSSTAATDIVSNADNSVCPANCLRPVGLAFDGQGRIFMSSDSSGEIYLVTRNASATGSSPSGSPTGSSTGSSASSTSASSARSAYGTISTGLGVICALFLFLLF